MSCNGQSIHNKPFELNFRQVLYLKSYLSLYQAVSAFGLNKSFDIAKKDYVGGYCMFFGHKRTQIALPVTKTYPDCPSRVGICHFSETGSREVVVFVPDFLADSKISRNGGVFTCETFLTKTAAYPDYPALRDGSMESAKQSVISNTFPSSSKNSNSTVMMTKDKPRLIRE